MNIYIKPIEIHFFCTWNLWFIACNNVFWKRKCLFI